MKRSGLLCVKQRGMVVTRQSSNEKPLTANLMSFHRNAGEKIKEAIAKGEFDNLPGKGRSLDLGAYFATPRDLTIGYSILKDAEIIPEEMELVHHALACSCNRSGFQTCLAMAT
jgi:hypothetical protein